MNPRIFMLQRVDQYHYEGGKYQVLSQNLINSVKKILDLAGIMAIARMSYIAYAQELYYIDHPTHRLYKRWKGILTKDDVTTKYLAMGLDSDVMTKIATLVG